MVSSSGMRDILQERRLGSDLKWAARPWHPVPTCTQPREASAQTIKDIALKSSRLRYIIKRMSDEEKIPINELNRRVASMLEEVGYNRELPVLRWLGAITSKMLKTLCSSIYVNEDMLLKLKAGMGRNPVLFVPTHRSYGDFVLMSYICFHYEIDIPRIAAGMDFHSMSFMGQALRDSCAFFMRRTFAEDKLYSATFSEYVQTLVTNGDAAIEFFIEGTRSRSGKSLMPKFGFLSMALRPYLTGLVPETTIIPVNISYERHLEEKLFAYELLGVPKPKESTKGFFKSLSILKENYGNVYVTFGEPISVSNALESQIDRSLHGYGPLALQDLTNVESKQVVRLAHQIIARQQQLTTITCFNVLAAVLNNKLLIKNANCSLDSLVDDVNWLTSVLRQLGARVEVDVTCTEDCVKRSLALHGDIISVTGGQLRVRVSSLHFQSAPAIILKGCDLSPQTMNIAIPFLMLHNYINACAHYYIPLCFQLLSLKWASFRKKPAKVELREKFRWLYQIFSHEFVLNFENEEHDFRRSLQQGLTLGILSSEDDKIVLGQNTKFAQFGINILASFLPAYLQLVIFLLSIDTAVPELEILKATQESVQQMIHQAPFLHPANLSLDTISNGIQSLSGMCALKKKKINGLVQLCPNKKELLPIRTNLAECASFLPAMLHCSSSTSKL